MLALAIQINMATPTGIVSVITSLGFKFSVIYKNNLGRKETDLLRASEASYLKI